jgi:hypothetical protein
MIAALAYSAAQVAQVLGMVGYPLADILIYAFSLAIAPAFLLAMLALHGSVEQGRRLWTLGALLFATAYLVYVALMYVTQLSVVIPRSLNAAPSGVLAVTPQSLFWDIDGLGYIAMGTSSLFAAFGLAAGGPGRWARRLLLANAAITPVIAFVYFYPHFSTVVLLLGLPWIVTAPGSLLALALYFDHLRGRGGRA